MIDSSRWNRREFVAWVGVAGAAGVAAALVPARAFVHSASAASVAQPAAAPVADGDLLAGIAPAELLVQILSGPFPADLLPDELGTLAVTPWDDGDSDLEGSLGGAIFIEGDPFSSNNGPGIAYIVYPDDSLPTESVQQVAAADEHVPLPAPLAYPAALVDYGDYVVCIVQFDYVLVLGSADGPGADARATPAASSEEARATAIAMAEAGVAYLERIAAGGATASPAAA